MAIDCGICLEPIEKGHETHRHPELGPCHATCFFSGKASTPGSRASKRGFGKKKFGFKKLKEGKLMDLVDNDRKYLCPFGGNLVCPAFHPDTEHNCPFSYPDAKKTEYRCTLGSTFRQMSFSLSKMAKDD